MNNQLSFAGYVIYISGIIVLMFAIRACGVADANDRAIGTDAKPQLRTTWPWE
jgi:hypothetical protein